jgi:HEAT repeat protein
VTQDQPPITGTIHILPFDKLSPLDFERLCLWLVGREGYDRAEHLGLAGSEQGRDVVAYRPTADGEQLWYFQCKRYATIRARTLKDEVDKYLELAQEKPQLRPFGVVFVVSCAVSAKVREEVGGHCEEHELAYEFWALTELDEKVKRHPDIVAEFFRGVVIYDGIKPVSIGDLLDACQAQVASVLHDTRHKYDPELYVNRAIERDLSAFFDAPSDEPAPNCFLIVAPAGSGKTNLLCDLARVRVSDQPVLLLMGGSTYLGGTTGLLGAVKEELETASSAVAFRSAADSLHTLHRLAEEMGRDALLFLDGINEHDRPAAMRQALEDLLRKTRGRRAKLVVTCRDYYWGLFKGQFWEGATVNSLPAEDGVDEDDIEVEADDLSRFAADEHERALDLYLAHYTISGRPVGDASEQCRHPLLLRFFCEAYWGQDVGQVGDIRLKELFDRYWDQKLVSIADRMIKQGDERLQDGLAEEVSAYLLNVAAYMLHNNVRAVPLSAMTQATKRTERYDDPRSVYGRIRDEFIILEEKERVKGRCEELQVAFVYEEFMEYVMARSLMRDWDRAGLDEAAILTEIEALTGKYASFAQILGVMVYLALMLKEERDLALWSLLLNKGERWQKTVFESIRKLPDRELDAGVFDTLEEMLVTGNQAIQKSVLDSIKIERLGKKAPASMVSLVTKLAIHRQTEIARRAVLALGNVSPNLALPILIKALNDQRREVRNNAITVVSKLGESAVEPLLEILRDSTRPLRQGAAATILGRIGDARAVEPLIAVLRGPTWSEYVQERVVIALGKLKDERAYELLVASLESDNWSGHIQKEAAVALGELGDERAVEKLTQALEHQNWIVRQGAAEGLRRIGTPDALAALSEERHSGTAYLN